MLIDEPLRGLDDAGIGTMLSFLRAQAARGAAVLVVAPKIDELRACGDVFYRLRGGKVYPWSVSRPELLECEEEDGYEVPLRAGK